MPVHEEPNPADPELTIRPSTPADRPQVERLIKQGLLPGHVDYESREADRIRQSLGSPRERFLVAESQGRIVGTLAVVEAAQDVGHLHWLRVDPAFYDDRKIARQLIKAAATHASEVGLLKLAMHAPAHIEQRVSTYYHQLGFEFSRAKEINGVHVLEFYLNLYERPKPPDE
jgi:N-acetylglutamate synthase-like GNAT family acetyltransferase